MEFMTDWETFMLDFHDEKILRVYRHKKVFTPHEQAKQYIDERIMDEVGDYMLNSSIELPNGELLVGMKRVYVNEEIVDHQFIETLELSDRIDYFHLKDIEFSDVTNSDEYSFLHRKDDEEADDEIQD